MAGRLRVRVRVPRLLRVRMPPRIIIVRTLVQILSLVVFFGGAIGLAATFVVLPVMMPLSNPYATVAGAWEVLEAMLTAGIVPFIALFVICLAALTIGRAGCAWWCPFGLISDLVAYVGKKKRVSTRANTAGARLALYIALFWLICDLCIFYGVHAGVDMRAYFGDFVREPSSIMEPTATIFSLLFWYVYLGRYPKRVVELRELLDYPAAFWFRILILVVILVLCYYYPRAYCRWLCPLGGLLGWLGRWRLLVIVRDPLKCRKCGECRRVCPMGLDPLSYERAIDDPLCILCCHCVAVCPSGALRLGIRR